MASILTYIGSPIHSTATEMNHVAIKFEGQIFSPFTGMPSETEDGPNEDDQSLLFVHYGDASEFGYLNTQAEEIVEELDDEEDGVDPVDVFKRLADADSILIEVDSGWNGVNLYAYRKPRA
jgi:hypothetical protein